MISPRILTRAAALAALLVPACQAGDVAAPVEPVPAFSVDRAAADPPFYARVELPYTIHTDEWAVVVFYRPPSCVRPDFNLLEFFDIPAAFFCGPLTVQGWEIRKTADPFAAPFQSELHGLGAVPVWLVSWADMEGAIADGDLKLAELESLPSLQMGSAHTFSEMLQPIPTRLPSRLVINAQGSLADGRRFRLHYTSQDDFSGNDVRSVRIDVW
jgi:hypothetical protein